MENQKLKKYRDLREEMMAFFLLNLGFLGVNLYQLPNRISQLQFWLTEKIISQSTDYLATRLLIFMSIQCICVTFFLLFVTLGIFFRKRTLTMIFVLAIFLFSFVYRLIAFFYLRSFDFFGVTIYSFITVLLTLFLPIMEIVYFTHSKRAKVYFLDKKSMKIF